MQGGFHPAFGGLGSSARSWCPTWASKGRQAVQPRQEDVLPKAGEIEEVRKGSAISGKAGVERRGE